MQNAVTNNVFWTEKDNNTTITKLKHKNPSQSRELNPEPIAPNADALHLHHQVN